MSRCVAARRCLAACLVVIAVLAMASPARAAGPAALPEPAGLVDHLAAWMTALWSAAGDLLGAEPPAGAESLDGGCILDPGGCHGAVVPPAGEEE